MGHVNYTDYLLLGIVIYAVKTQSYGVTFHTPPGKKILIIYHAKI